MTTPEAGRVEQEWEKWASVQPESRTGWPLVATYAAFKDAYALGYAQALTTQAETIRRLEGTLATWDHAMQRLEGEVRAWQLAEPTWTATAETWRQRAEAAEGRLEQRYATGYLVGQLAMRERAAKKAMEPLAPTTYAETYSTAISEAIRALEPEEPQ